MELSPAAGLRAGIGRVAVGMVRQTPTRKTSTTNAALHDEERPDRSVSDKVNLRRVRDLGRVVMLACGIGGGRKR